MGKKPGEYSASDLWIDEEPEKAKIAYFEAPEIFWRQIRGWAHRHGLYQEFVELAPGPDEKFDGALCVKIFEELQKMFSPPASVMLPELEKTKQEWQNVVDDPFSTDEERATASAALVGIEQEIVKARAEIGLSGIDESLPAQEGNGSSGAAEVQEPLKAAAKEKGSKSKKKKSDLPGHEARELPDGSMVYSVGPYPPEGGYPVLGSEDDPGTYNYWLEVAKRVGVDSDKVESHWNAGVGGTCGIEQLGQTLCKAYPKIDVYHWCLNFIKEKSISASILAAVWRKTDINWKDDTAKIKHELAGAIATGGMSGLDLTGMDMARAAAEIGQVYLSQSDIMARAKAAYDKRCERAKAIQGFIEKYLAPDFAHWIEENKEPGTKYAQTETSRWQLRSTGSVEYASDEKAVTEWLEKQTPEMLAGLGIEYTARWYGATDAKLYKAGCPGVTKTTGEGVEKVHIE